MAETSGLFSTIGNYLGNAYNAGKDFLQKDSTQKFIGEYSNELIQVGMQLVGEATKPDAPSVKPYKAMPMPERSISDFNPNIPLFNAMQSDVALSMLAGELPAAVVDQIETTTGEAAYQGGFAASESRTRNVLARNLGFKQMEVINRGIDLARKLTTDAERAYNTAVQGDIARSNMAFDEWSSYSQELTNKYKRKAEEHANRINTTTSILAQGETNRRLQAERERQDKIMDKLLDMINTDQVDVNVLTKGSTNNNEIKTTEYKLPPPPPGFKYDSNGKLVKG